MEKQHYYQNLNPSLIIVPSLTDLMIMLLVWKIVTDFLSSVLLATFLLSYLNI